MAKVFIGVPCLDARVGHDFAFSLADTMQELRYAGHQYDGVALTGNATLCLARDELVDAFLKTDCTHLLQLDSDLGWHGMDIVRMIEKKKEFIAGVYPVKRREPEFRVSFNGLQEDGLMGVTRVPGGFQLIARSAILKAIETFPELQGQARVKDGKIAMLHMHQLMNGVFTGEDTVFCTRLMQSGVSLWIDPTINLRHWSGTECYGHKLLGTMIKEREK